MATEKSPASPALFDLASPELAALQQAQEEGTDVHIMHPISGEDTGMVIRVAGPDSERARKARNDSTTKKIKARRLAKLDGEELDDDNRMNLAKMVISWSGFVYNGQPIPCAPDRVAKVFRDFPFIYEQVNLAAGDRGSFIKS